MVKFFVFAKILAVVVLIFANFSNGVAQSRSIYLLRAGKRIRVKMDTEINSKVASVNDTFTVSIAESVSNNGVVVLPSGLRIDGKVTAAEAADVGNEDGRLEVAFVRLILGRGKPIDVNAGLVKPLHARDRSFSSFLTVVGGAAAGALFGGALGSRRGAAIGAAVGAGSGTGYVLLRKGRDVRIKTDEEFEIELKKDVMLPASREY